MGNSRYVSQISISEIRNSRLISRYDLIISISKWKHRICHHGNSRASAVVIRSPTLSYYYTVNNPTLAGYEPKSLKWTWEETRLKSKLISKLIGHFSCYLRKRNHNKKSDRPWQWTSNPIWTLKRIWECSMFSLFEWTTSFEAMELSKIDLQQQCRRIDGGYHLTMI